MLGVTTNNRPTLSLDSKEVTALLTKFIAVLLETKPGEPNLFESEVNLPVLESLQEKFFSKSPELLELNPELTIHSVPFPVVAHLLLDSLLRLTEPLLTFKYYDSFLLIEYIVRPSDKIELCRSLFSQLPPWHTTIIYQLLTLLRHLVVVLDYSPHQLATVFGNIFLRPFRQIYYMENDAKSIFKFVTFLIDNFNSLLGVEDDKSKKTTMMDFHGKPRSGSVSVLPGSYLIGIDPYISDLTREVN